MQHRRTRWFVPFLAASLVVTGALSSVASAKNGRGGGKKARGEVTSFDAGSMALEVALRNGETFTGTVDPDVQVKLEHRGNHAHGQGHGNPSRGSLEDIVPGAQVLRMKIDGDVVEKIRLRAAPAAADPCATEEEEGEGEGETEGPVVRTTSEIEEGEETECEEGEEGTEVEPEEGEGAEEEVPPVV